MSTFAPTWFFRAYLDRYANRAFFHAFGATCLETNFAFGMTVTSFVSDKGA